MARTRHAIHARARFGRGNAPYTPLRVIGTDATFVYVVDGCGLRRVAPVTGAATAGMSRAVT